MSDSDDKKRPILYDYFKKTADVLLAEYERSKISKASDNLGYNRELFCKKFLSCVLPPRLTLRQGEIWDSQGNRTGQLEIIILRDDAASLAVSESGANIYLAEGVFGIIEVKSNLSKEKLQEALDQLRYVKSLNLRVVEIAHCGPVLNRPLRCVFAYEGATWETLLEELDKPNNIDVADLICILNRGILISSYPRSNGEDNREGNEEIEEGDIPPYHIVNGKAASLAFLYARLVSYSTSFIARSWDISQYFEPLEVWLD